MPAFLTTSDFPGIFIAPPPPPPPYPPGFEGLQLDGRPLVLMGEDLILGA